MLRDIVKSETASTLGDAVVNLPKTPGVDSGDVISLGASMIIIVGIILVLGWIYSRSRVIGGGNSDVINVIATRALGPKERLLVVEVADQQLLVGITASDVQTLHVFDKPVVVEKAARHGAGFAGRLRSALREISG